MLFITENVLNHSECIYCNLLFAKPEPITNLAVVTAKIQTLANLLEREPDSIRNHYLIRLLPLHYIYKSHKTTTIPPICSQSWNVEPLPTVRAFREQT